MFFLLFFFFSTASAQTTLLKSGPMVGYSTQTEVLIWVQATSESKVQVRYRKKNSKEIFLNSVAEITRKDKGYTSKLKIGNLEPSSRYDYELLINDNKISFNYPLEFQTNSTDTIHDFKVAIGSCAIFTGDTTVTHIYESIASKKPDMMLWLGDNIYLDATDWDSVQNIMKKYTANRSLVQLQPLLAATHHYAIWDDHDYGPDNSDSSFYNKKISREAFENFWANPSFGIDGRGVTTSFSWNDVDFFLLDDRYNRAPDSERSRTKPYLGPSQINWLMTSLKKSKARFKLIVLGNQLINKMPFEKENYSSYKQEQKSLFRQIKDSGIEGILFITGDRHFSEISRMKRRGTYPFYDLTVSPLTSTAITTRLNFNTRRVRKSLIRKRNFAVLEFCGSGTERVMKINYFDTQGSLLYQNVICADYLKNQ
ncbi:MAG TPA: alkaline phosphatase D family protein [Cytophagaceae bacterium]|nr:alkaline phosphatase D family protein [Cytophagaceae bacterium]